MITELFIIAVGAFTLSTAVTTFIGRRRVRKMLNKGAPIATKNEEKKR